MAPPPTLAAAPLAQVAAALRRRTESPLELLEAYQQRIEPAAELRAFITPPGERARREAQRAQQQLARRQAGGLLGVPIAGKDLVATRGLRLRRAEADLRAPAARRGRTAGVVVRPRRAPGADGRRCGHSPRCAVRRASLEAGAAGDHERTSGRHPS